MTRPMAAAVAWSCASMFSWPPSSLSTPMLRTECEPGACSSLLRDACSNQPKVSELAAREAVMLVCGRYEGFDERVRSYVDEEISLGDFVMTGGEVAAMAIVDACARLQPRVLGNEASVVEESHSAATGGLLEYPH